MNAWLLVLAALAAWTTLSLIAGKLVGRVLRWCQSSPARVPPAGAVPPAPVRAEDYMREWDLEAGEYFTEWSR